MGEKLHHLRFLSRLLLAMSLLCLASASLVSTSLQRFATDLHGKPVDPFVVARDKVVVLIFVRTDCPVSNRYAPTVQQLSAQNREKASFFLVYPSRKETPAAIPKHDREFGYTLAALRDPQHIL